MTFRDFPIRRKLAILVASATAIALVMACALFAFDERARFRESTVAELSVLADVMGANTAASLAFNDQRTAHEMLAALSADPKVLAACLYDDKGRLFAEYRSPRVPPDFQLPQWHQPGRQFNAQFVTLFQSVLLKGDRTGSIAIVSDFASFREKMLHYLRLDCLVLIAVLLAASLISNRFFRIITDPILELSSVAAMVSTANDYSLRVKPSGNDEVGLLIRAFNEMLNKIHNRDIALLNANDDLELRVLTRTVELEKEVQVRKQTEAEMRGAKEAAEVANLAKSEFLANMSHEIRTPLNGVVGMTELALEAQPEAEQREFLETIKSSADALLIVVNDILDFSKIEAGKMELENVDFNLTDCLELCLKPLALLADEKQVELLCDIAQDVPEMIRGDSTRLRQVILNLVGNAIKFTHTGEVGIRVEVENKGDGTPGSLHFTVSDTGIGIAPEKRESIFNAFSQADTSTTRNYGGTGLGLAICNRLVDMMGGKIWFESELGSGSRFHFTKRLELAVDSCHVPTAAPLEAFSAWRVLIVDDNATNRRILRGMLSSWNITTCEAESGEEAFAKILAAKADEKPYQLILTDVHMPNMDGFWLVQRIRETPGLASAAVIMMTSAGYRGHAESYTQLAISDYLVKPIRKRELLGAILKTLGPVTPIPHLVPTSAGTTLSVRNLHILLAEDNHVNQVVASRMLAKMGHSIVLANTGVEALLLLQQQKFDLVLMDIQMPEMDGLTATTRIREDEANAPTRIPIIALTAHAMTGDRERYLAAGMDGYISKPITTLELQSVIADVMRKCQDVAIPTNTAALTDVSGNVSTHGKAAFDVALCMERLGGDETLFREVLDIFLIDGPRQIGALRRAMTSGNAAEVEKVSHSLKGELGYMGIVEATNNAAQLEGIGRSGNLQQGAEVLIALETEMLSILDSMRGIVAGNPEAPSGIRTVAVPLFDLASSPMGGDVSADSSGR